MLYSAGTSGVMSLVQAPTLRPHRAWFNRHVCLPLSAQAKGLYVHTPATQYGINGYFNIGGTISSNGAAPGYYIPVTRERSISPSPRPILAFVTIKPCSSGTHTLSLAAESGIGKQCGIDYWNTDGMLAWLTD